MGLLDKYVSESDFQASIIEMATLFRWRHYHTHDSRRSVPGFPDLVLLRNGVLVVAELKKVGRYPTLEQMKWLMDFHLAGADAYVWTPKDWGTIEIVLRGHPGSCHAQVADSSLYNYLQSEKHRWPLLDVPNVLL